MFYPYKSTVRLVYLGDMQLSTSDLFVLIPVILISITFHESMHAFAAYWLGDDTAHNEGRISLNPLKHIDPFTTLLLPLVTLLVFHVPLLAAKPVPFNPARVKFDEFGAAIIGVAGPLTNLALAAIGALMLRNLHLSTTIFNFLGIFVMINVALFVFNMIPFPPLDGSRLLYAVAPEPLQKLMYQIESMGFTAILLFFVILVPVIGPLLVYLNSHLLHFLLGSMYQV